MNIDKLKKVIVEAVPEIMALEFGCQIKTKNGIYFYYRRLDDVLSDGYSDMELRTIDEGCGCCSSPESFKIGECEILGSPIRLADVLLAMRKKSFPGAAGKQTLLSRMIEADVTRDWNLAKDNLDDQSDECKAFLISLLVR